MKVTLNSGKYPGVSFSGGVPYLYNGVATEITPEQKAIILNDMKGFPANVLAELKIHFDDGEPAATLAIQNPIPAPPVEPVKPEKEEADGIVAEDIAELSYEDLELVEIEIGKILDKTIAEAEPRIIKTGGAEELPRALRVEYLTQIQSHEKIQKGLKETAAKLLEQI